MRCLLLVLLLTFTGCAPRMLTDAELERKAATPEIWSQIQFAAMGYYPTHYVYRLRIAVCQTLVPKPTAEQIDNIQDGFVTNGMTYDMVIVAMGFPDDDFAQSDRNGEYRILGWNIYKYDRHSYQRIFLTNGVVTYMNTDHYK